MEQYNGIINALSPKFAFSYEINILNPLYITDLYDVDNTIILAKYSELYFGENLNLVRPDEIFFIPGGRPTNITYGAKDGPIKTQENFISERIFGLQNPIGRPHGSNPKHRFITVNYKAKVVGVSEDYVGEYFKYLPELIHRIIKKINEWKR